MSRAAQLKAIQQREKRKHRPTKGFTTSAPDVLRKAHSKGTAVSIVTQTPDTIDDFLDRLPDLDSTQRYTMRKMWAKSWEEQHGTEELKKALPKSKRSLLQ